MRARGYFNIGKSSLLQYPVIYALLYLGLPVNKIIMPVKTVLKKEDLVAELEKRTSGSIIAWDDVGHWMHKPEKETWPLLAWWDFQRWAFR